MFWAETLHGHKDVSWIYNLSVWLENLGDSVF